MFLAGRTPFHGDSPAIGVQRKVLYFSFGSTDTLIDAWTANLDTPLFTVQAYDTTRFIAFVGADDLFLAEEFAHLITSVVSVDASDEVRRFATDLRVPLFETGEGFYWALHHAVAG